jgi:hypothetical protein
MSAPSPHSFRCCAGFHAADVEVVRRNAMTEVKPLAPVAGAAAFLFARSRSSSVQQRVFIKERIETQANRHF